MVMDWASFAIGAGVVMGVMIVGVACLLVMAGIEGPGEDGWGKEGSGEGEGGGGDLEHGEQDGGGRFLHTLTGASWRLEPARPGPDLESPYAKITNLLEDLSKAGNKFGFAGARSPAGRKLARFARRAIALQARLEGTENMNAPDLMTPSSLADVQGVTGTGGIRRGRRATEERDASIDAFETSLAAAGRKDFLRSITKSTPYEVDHLHRTSDGDLVVHDHEAHPVMLDSGIMANALPFVDGRILHHLQGYGEDFTVDTLKLDGLTKGRPLVTATLHVLQALGLIDKLDIDGEKLCAYLSAVEEGYFQENPYHNNAHAAVSTSSPNRDFTGISTMFSNKLNLLPQDVVQRLVTLLVKSEVYPGVVTDRQMMAAILSAAIHDYEHPGTNNSYHIATQNPLARTYNDQHVLENHSLMSCLELLRLDKHNFLCKGGESGGGGGGVGCGGGGFEDSRDLRSCIIDMVLATDIGAHWDILTHFQTKVRTDALAGTLSSPSRAQQTLILKLALKCADLGHCALPLQQHIEWVGRLEKEFFSQGDNEKREGLPVSPLMDREKPGPACGKSQIGFFDFVVLPLYRAWVETFPRGRGILEGAHSNYLYWRAAASVDPEYTARNSVFEVHVPDPILAKLDKAAEKGEGKEEGAANAHDRDAEPSPKPAQAPFTARRTVSNIANLLARARISRGSQGAPRASRAYGSASGSAFYTT